jgi:hypothetical protein
LHLLQCLPLFLISLYRDNICLRWENIEATTTAINACKKVVWRWSKGGKKKNIYVNYLTSFFSPKLTDYFIQGVRNVAPLWHIHILIPSQSVFVTNNNFIVFGLTRPELDRFPRIIVFHCWIKLSIYSVLAVFQMYFTIKYNVFYKNL